MAGADFFEDDPEQTRQRLRTAAAAEREWLRDNAGVYEAARARWQDLDWCHDGLLTCREVLAAVADYDPATEPARKAVYILAQAKLSLQSVLGQVEFIEIYEAHRANFAALSDNPDTLE